MMRKFLRTAVRFAAQNWLLVLTTLGAAAGLVATLIHQPLMTNWILGSVAAIATLALLVRMAKDLRDGSYGVNVLGVITLGAAILLAQFWVGIAIAIVLCLIDLIKDVVMHYARREVRELHLQAPMTAHVVRKNQILEAKYNDLQVRAIIVIKAGEIVPADAIITEGSSSFDESALTGERTAQTLGVGDLILCGSTNRAETVRAEVLHVPADSQYRRTVRLAEAAAEHTAPFTHLAELYSLPFAVVALTIGGVAGIISHDPMRFLDVLVAATPAPLILATPVTIAAGLSRALRDGIVMKTGNVLEQLAQARTVAFAKGGVLTAGAPAITNVISFSPFKKAEVLGLAASAEQSARSPLARAIIAEAVGRNLKLAKARHVHEIAGRGLEAHIKNTDVLVGNLTLMEKYGVVVPRRFDTIRTQTAAVYVAINGRLAGYLTMRDAARPEAKPALQTLRRLGVRHMVMLTGDQQMAATALGKPLGITEIIAEKSPGEKLVAIGQLAPRPAVFVGNAGLDAPLLMAADIGIALGVRGDAIASSYAGILIMRQDLMLVANAIATARHTLRVAVENIAVGLTLDIALMLLFATGRLPAAIGVLTQGIFAALVLAGALRARTVTLPPRR